MSQTGSWPSKHSYPMHRMNSRLSLLCGSPPKLPGTQVPWKYPTNWSYLSPTGPSDNTISAVTLSDLTATIPSSINAGLAQNLCHRHFFSSSPGLGDITCAQPLWESPCHLTSMNGTEDGTQRPFRPPGFLSEKTVFPVSTTTTTCWYKLVPLEMPSSLCRQHQALKAYSFPPASTKSCECASKLCQNYTSKIMDRTGAPPKTWFLCLLYSVYLATAASLLHAQLFAWGSPSQFCFCGTLLTFCHWSSSLSMNQSRLVSWSTGERSARFVGIAENQGNALTYRILTDDTINCLPAQWSAPRSRQEPNKQVSSSTESKGSAAPDPVALDLTSDLSWWISGFRTRPIPGLFLCTCEIPTVIPHKTTVIDVNKETGHILLEYIHGQDGPTWHGANPQYRKRYLRYFQSWWRWYWPYGHSPWSWTTKLKTIKSMSRSNGTTVMSPGSPSTTWGRTTLWH